ncbi:MAG: sigma-70 family RNA polymerase sigma factor [Acidimicrobiales bacterium]
MMEQLTTEERATVEANVPLVRHIVRRLSGRFPSSYCEDDLIQTGMMGLIEATRRYDPDRGIAFSTFAGRRIEGAVYDLMRSEDWLPRSRRNMERQIAAAEQELTSRNGERPNESQIGDMLGMTAKQVDQARTHVMKARVDSLDRPIANGPSVTSLGEMVESDEEGPEDNLAHAEMLGYLRDGLDLLPERHRLVLIGFFFEGKSVTEIGAFLGVTQSRASQLKNEAIEMLRVGMSRQFDESPAEDESRGRQRRFNDELATASAWRDRVSLSV